MDFVVVGYVGEVWVGTPKPLPSRKVWRFCHRKIFEVWQICTLWCILSAIKSL